MKDFLEWDKEEWDVIESIRLYDDFLDWAEAQELDFPCTATAFTARATAFIAASGRNNEDLNTLLRQGGVNDEA